MDIYLLRTSSRVEAATGAADAPRGLSLEGRRLVRALATKLRDPEPPSFDRVLTSPDPAAVQTAELFAERLDHVGLVEVLPSLAGGVPPHVLAPVILERGAAVLVVADEPALSELGAFLVGRPTFPPPVPAQVSVIRDRQPAWCLRPGELGRAQLLVA